MIVVEHLSPRPHVLWRLVPPMGSWIHLAQDVVSINGSAAGYSLSPNFPITPVNFDHPGNLLSLNATTVLGPRTTNDLRIGFSRHPVTILPDDPDALTDAGTGIDLPTLFTPAAGWIPDFTFNGSRISNSPKWDASQAPTLYWPGLAGGKRVPRIGSPTGAVAIDPTTGAPYSTTIIGRLVPDSGNLTDGILVAGQGVDKYMIKDQGILLGPRLGVVYDLTGRGNLIFRAGAGKYFDRYQGNLIFGTILNPPSIYTPVLYNGFAQYISPNSATLAPSGLSVLSYDGKIPTTYMYSAGIQARLPWAIVLETSYVGSQGRHLIGTRNLNGIPYGTAFLPENQDPTKVAANPNAPLGSNAYDAIFLRPYQGYGSITRNEFGNNSNYNALQVTLNRRFAEGLFFGASYTWSKCLDFGSNDGSSLRSDDRTREANYGPCDYDVRHNLAVNYVYALPGVSKVRARLVNNPVTRALFDGWQISGTTRFRTGMPFTPSYNVPGYSGVNFTGTPDYGARVKLAGDPHAGTTSDPYNRLNPAAFAPPSVGSIGMETGRNYLNTPGVNNWDMSLQKTVTIKGNVRMELRVDAFNVFNHPQFSGINSTVSFASLANPTVTNPGRRADGSENRGGFGTVSGVRPARILQTVVRLRF